MRFLHTSDWHLGKIFHQRPLLEDQKYILDQIYDELVSAKENGNPYAALLVPGDIYDRAVPVADAVTLLSGFLVRLNEALPELHMFFISGNHDSATRLSFCSEFLGRSNIHFVTDTKKFQQPVIISRGEEKTAVYQLPFLNPLSINGEGDELLRSQQDLYMAACSKIKEYHAANCSEMAAVVCAHLFAAGSGVQASERSFVGTAEQVDASLFDFADYGAFGHIHKFQCCDKANKCFYSGSPMAFNFDDSPECFMLSVNVSEKKTAVVEKLPFKPLHKIAKLQGCFSDFYGNGADKSIIEENKENYVQIILTDENIPQNAMALLQVNFPYLMLITPKSLGNSLGASSIQARRNAIKSSSPELIFQQFLNDAYGAEREDSALVIEEKKLFSEEAKTSEWEA